MALTKDQQERFEQIRSGQFGSNRQKPSVGLEIIHTATIFGQIVVVARYKASVITYRVNPETGEAVKYDDMDVAVMREAIMAIDAHETQAALEDDDKPDEDDVSRPFNPDDFKKAIESIRNLGLHEPRQDVLDAVKYGQGLSQFNKPTIMGVDLAKDTDKS